MTINNKLIGIGLGTAMGLAAAIGTAFGQDVRKVGYTVPTTEGARYLGEKKKDMFPGIPGKETIIRWYETDRGTRFAAYFVKNKKGKERVYGFDVDTTGAPPWEYSLIDTLGDKNFQVFKPGTNVTIPNGWLDEFINSTG